MSPYASTKELAKFLRKIDKDGIPAYRSDGWVRWHLDALRLCGNLEAPAHQSHIQRLIILLVTGVYP